MPSSMRHRLLISLAVISLFVVWSGNSHGETTYTYDELNRLKRVDYGNETIIEYDYYPGGNRRTVQSPAPPTGTISIDSGAAATPSTNITLSGRWDHGKQAFSSPDWHGYDLGFRSGRILS